MNPAEPEFLYLGLILPSLFALTLIIDGLHKLLSNQSGWLSLWLGLVFLTIITCIYFFVFR